LEISDFDRVVLERRVRDRGALARDVLRARIVLLTGPQTAQRVGAPSPRWCCGGGGLLRTAWPVWRTESVSPPPRTTVTDEVRDEILTATLTPLPAELGITHWSSRLLAQWLGRRGIRVSNDSISRLWRRFGIQPRRCETFNFSTTHSSSQPRRGLLVSASTRQRDRVVGRRKNCRSRPWIGPRRCYQCSPDCPRAKPMAIFGTAPPHCSPRWR
jgi:hypothetical protein